MIIFHGRAAAEGEALPIFRTLDRRMGRAQREAQALSDCLELYTRLAVEICEDVAALHRAGKISADETAKIIGRQMVTNSACQDILRGLSR